MLFKKKQINKLQYLQTDLFDRKVVHGFFLKHGGVSLAPYISLNVSLDVEDDLECVYENRKILQSVFSFDAVVYLKQVHGCDIVYIDELPKNRLSVDGMITKKKNLALCIQTADCQPAIFYDPKQQIIGALHVGWRGLLLNVYFAMVQKMQKLGSRVSDIQVAIGPSIGKQSFEFIDWKQIFPPHFASYQAKANFFDLKQIAKDQLLQAGILPQHICVSDYCSFQDEDCFSYRREQRTGRLANIIALL